MSLVRALALTVLGFAVLLAGRATAMEEPLVTLDYDAFATVPGCPSSRDFRRIVTQQLGYDPFRDKQSRRVVVRVEATESGVEGRVEWQDATGTPEGEQKFSSHNQDCGKLSKTMGFAIVVQIQLLGTPGAPPVNSPPDPIKTPPSEASPPAAVVPARPTPERSFWIGLGPFVGIGLAPALTFEGSANLKDWTTVATVPNGVPGVKNTWAPEWFIDSDGTVHVTVTLDLKTYRYEPTDSTLTKWGPGTFIGLNGTIDTQIIRIGTTYHAIIPNRHGTSSSLDGPWTFGSDYKAPPNCKEAPAVVHVSGNTWRFYCDDGGSGHEKSSLTTDLFQTWSSLQTLPVVGDNISHGTVIRGDTGHPF